MTSRPVLENKTPGTLTWVPLFTSCASATFFITIERLLLTPSSLAMTPLCMHSVGEQCALLPASREYPRELNFKKSSMCPALGRTSSPHVHSRTTVSAFFETMGVWSSTRQLERSSSRQRLAGMDYLKLNSASSSPVMMTTTMSHTLPMLKNPTFNCCISTLGTPVRHYYKLLLEKMDSRLQGRSLSSVQCASRRSSVVLQSTRVQCCEPVSGMLLSTVICAVHFQ